MDRLCVILMMDFMDLMDENGYLVFDCGKEIYFFYDISVVGLGK